MAEFAPHIGGRRTFIKGIGATAILGTAGCLGSDETQTIEYAGITGALLNDLLSLFNLSDYMVEEVLEHRGDRYEFEFVDVSSTPVVVNTLGAGEADAGLLAYSSIANAIEQDVISGGQTIVAPLTYDGPRYADTYCALAGSDVEAPADLDGNALGVNGVGSAIDIAARYVLTQEGIDMDDVEVREVDFPAMFATLDGGGIDAGTFIQPFYQMNRDDLQVVFDTSDAFGDFLKIFVTFRDEFLEENGEAVEYMLEDFWTGMQWWIDDANDEQRLDITEEVIGLPRELLAQLVQTDEGYYHGEDGLLIDPAWIQAPVDGMFEVGFLDEQIDMADHVDNSYLPDEAAVEPFA